MKILLMFGLMASMTLLRAESEAAENTTFTRNRIREILREAQTFYAGEEDPQPAEAAARFRALREQAPEGELNPDALKLAEGMAMLKSGDAENALKLLEEVTDFDASAERARLRQMKGNARMKLSEEAVEAGDWEPAKDQMNGAIEAFMNALRENPEMDAARNNLELAQRRLEEIKKMEPPPPEDQQQEEEDKQEEEEEEDKGLPEQQQDSPSQDEPRDQEPDQTPEPRDQRQPGEDQSQEESEAGQEEEMEGQPDGASETEAGESEPTDAEAMDARQAEQILEAALEQEKRQRRLIQQRRVRSLPVEKDW